MPVRASSLLDNTVSGIDREVGSQYDNVKIVAENIDSVVTLARDTDTLIEN